MSDIDGAFRNGKIAEIENEGFEASLQHVPLSDNPYIENSWEYEAWANGHISADRMNMPRYGVHH